jgi:HKD family nuclease
MPSGEDLGDGLSFVFQSPSTGMNLQEVLEEGLRATTSYDRLRILAATISERGVTRIEDELTNFCETGNEIEVYIGLSMGPDPEGIRRLKRLQNQYPGLVSLKLIKNSTSVNLFHPKVYWFCSETKQKIILGSPNWSDLGFENNIEAFSVVTETTVEEESSEFVSGVKSAFDEVRTLNESGDSWGSLHSPSESILDQLETSASMRTGQEQTQVEIDTDGPDEDGLWPLSRTGPELVMELNKESRMSQIVPPNEIWRKYFDVDSDEFRESDPELPTFELRNKSTGERSRRHVVTHDHQGTIEIPEAKDRKDPAVQRAFLVFQKTGTQSYDYQLFLEGEHEEADQIAEFLESNGYTPGRSQRLTYISRPS